MTGLGLWEPYIEGGRGIAGAGSQTEELEWWRITDRTGEGCLSESSMDRRRFPA